MKKLTAIYLSISLTSLTFAGEWTGNDCFCDRSLPVFESDPLVVADAGIISFVAPQMVTVNPAGECVVENINPIEGFYEGEARATFFLGSEEYAQVQIFPTDDYSGEGRFATMEELNTWALELCSQKSLNS